MRISSYIKFFCLILGGDRDIVKVHTVMYDRIIYSYNMLNY